MYPWSLTVVESQYKIFSFQVANFLYKVRHDVKFSSAQFIDLPHVYIRYTHTHKYDINKTLTRQSSPMKQIRLMEQTDYLG